MTDEFVAHTAKYGQNAWSHCAREVVDLDREWGMLLDPAALTMEIRYVGTMYGYGPRRADFTYAEAITCVPIDARLGDRIAVAPMDSGDRVTVFEIVRLEEQIGRSIEPGSVTRLPCRRAIVQEVATLRSHVDQMEEMRQARRTAAAVSSAGYPS